MIPIRMDSSYFMALLFLGNTQVSFTAESVFSSQRYTTFSEVCRL